MKLSPKRPSNINSYIWIHFMG